MARTLTKGGSSKKRQGKEVTGASQSATNLFPEMRTLGRGLGSAFDFAVNKFIDEAPSIRGSLNPFLGVDKKTLDPAYYQSNTLVAKKPLPGKK